ncbi:NAD-dependent epimerase/dehydratase family protein [Subtercola lobariae]|uniref:NAD-dependent epimerase n=1 Tax=Subtercola lobariae TaxID=1588641 RepID=A0A917BFC9_9MICO|nr:NAD(P)-dependent oxidoreductase [Subtercola lobariae]GGF39503.1 NAD-dependent epimerase [Subtercola lobariae]
MILVTGGSGFIGSHTVRALHNLGEQALIVQRRSGEVPPHLADLPVVAERGDVSNLDSLREIGSRHTITGIVHLAGYDLAASPGPAVESAQKALAGLFNIVQVAQEWEVKRVGIASTIGVYGGLRIEGALREDTPVMLSAPHPIPRYKKINELLGEQLAETSGVDIINLRISGTWGPLGHEDPFFAAPALIHAAAARTAPDFSGILVPVNSDDALDLTYVKDTGRAIALIQLTERLNHRTYNVASGRATTNADIIAAIKTINPDSEIELPAGSRRPHNYLDITRIHDDTGYQPEYDTQRAAADYIAWLRAGNMR